MTASGSGDFGDYRSQVLAATDIVELIGRNVALKRRGRDYVGLCPFHQEKTPSFTVKPERQYFYCFGCKANGNAIDFVMQRDRLSFVDALNQLGELAGVERPRGGPSREKAGEKQVLLEAQSAACSLFEKLLAHPEQGAAAREYLKQRGINAESVKRFQIGLAIESWDTLLKSPLLRKFRPEQLAAAGLVKRREKGPALSSSGPALSSSKGDGFYDTFRNRLMFPIRDESSRVIAFGGRVMPGSQDPAKYLNSPETPLFSKSRCVFGIDLARQKIIESRTAVVVEGYTDVVMAHQFGAANVVSILGTAMTEQHVAILRRFADRIVLLFDADSAGDAAVDRAVNLFVTQPVEIAIAQIDSGLDPDEYLLKEGAETFDRLIAAAPDALSYKWTQLTRRLEADGDSLTAQQKAVEQYLDLLSQARKSGPVDAIRWGGALVRVSRLTEIPVEQLHRRFGTAAGAGPKRPFARARPMEPASAPGSAAPAGPRRPPMARERAERWILGILLLKPDHHQWLAVQKSVSTTDFTDDARRRLAELYWAHQQDLGEPVFNEFLGSLGDESAGGNPLLQQLAVEVVEEVESLADSAATLAEAVGFIGDDRGRQDKRKLEAQFRRTDGEMTEQDEVALFRKLQEKARQPDLRRG